MSAAVLGVVRIGTQGTSTTATHLLALAKASLRASVLLLQLRGALGGGGFGLAAGGRAARGAAVPAAAAPLLLRGVRRRVATAACRRPPQLVPVSGRASFVRQGAGAMQTLSGKFYGTRSHRMQSQDTVRCSRPEQADRLPKVIAADGGVSCTLQGSANHLKDRGATSCGTRCSVTRQVCAYLPSPTLLQCFRQFPASICDRKPALSKASNLLTKHGQAMCTGGTTACSAQVPHKLHRRGLMPDRCAVH